MQIDLNATDSNKAITDLDYINEVPSLQMAPDGYIYLASYFDYIKYPDKKGLACNIKKSNLPPIYAPFLPSVFKGPQLAVQYNSCSKLLSITKNTDTIYFKTFRWYFPNGDSLSGKAVYYDFEAEYGKQQIRLKSIDKHGGIHWVTDTILYIKPPNASFSHKDTSGCQWVGYKFINTSTSDTIHPIFGESYIWDFGDGTTDTAENPIHIYTKAGTYDVSLIYSNGFCTDTFTRQQTVEILPAPKPGFTVDTTEGCAPLNIKINYTPTADVC